MLNALLQHPLTWGLDLDDPGPHNDVARPWIVFQLDRERLTTGQLAMFARIVYQRRKD